MNDQPKSLTRIVFDIMKMKSELLLLRSDLIKNHAGLGVKHIDAAFADLIAASDDIYDVASKQELAAYVRSENE